MKKYVNSIDKHIDKGVSFSDISYLVEMFPSPIPKEINGVKIHTANDLFRMSNATGLFELYIPDSTSITGEVGDKKIKFSQDEFIAWQRKIQQNSRVERIFFGTLRALSRKRQTSCFSLAA